MADTTPDTRPVDREYLDLRLSELEARIDTKLAQELTKIYQAISGLHRTIAISILVPMLGLIVTLLIAVLIK